MIQQAAANACKYFLQDFKDEPKTVNALGRQVQKLSFTIPSMYHRVPGDDKSAFSKTATFKIQVADKILNQITSLSDVDEITEDKELQMVLENYKEKLEIEQLNDDLSKFGIEEHAVIDDADSDGECASSISNSSSESGTDDSESDDSGSDGI